MPNILKKRSDMQVSFPSIDGFLLGGCYWSAGPVGVLIGCATGVRQSFYSAYAKYLSENGISVLTFDYRGLGASMGSQRLQDIDAGVFPHWQYDMTAALRFLSKKTTQVTIIGHSVGGHLAAMMTGADSPKRVLMVAANSAYCGNLKIGRVSSLLFNRGGPLAGSLLKYFPSKTMGLGDNIPIRAGLQWATWSRRRSYFLDTHAAVGTAAQPVNAESKVIQQLLNSFSAPVLALSFEDDEMAHKRAFLDFVAFLPSSKRVWTHVRPPTPVGHHGFFRASSGKEYWAKSLDWINNENPYAFGPPKLVCDAGHGGFVWVDSIKSKL